MLEGPFCQIRTHIVFFGLMLYIPVMLGPLPFFPDWTSSLLLKDTTQFLQLGTSWSEVEHLTTEPLHSHLQVPMRVEIYRHNRKSTDDPGIPSKEFSF